MAMVVPRSPTSSSSSSSTSEFNFNNIASAPSSPKPFGGNPDDYYYFYTSAPSSPNRAASIYSFLQTRDEDWEEMPMAPKHASEFEFGLGVPSKITTADELFYRGQIKPFGKYDEQTAGSDTMLERGRQVAAPGRSKREARSLSPPRAHSTSVPASPAPPPVKSNGSKKWRLKDLLLFRSSSEGRVTGRGSRDPLRKYSVLSSSSSSSSLLSPSINKKKEADSSVRRASKQPMVSAHELHYTENRAAAEEMKKKTPLPYNRNSFLGFLHFNPAVKTITRGFRNSSSFSRGRP